MTSLGSGWHDLCCSLPSDPESTETVVVLGIAFSRPHYTCTPMAREEYCVYTAYVCLFSAHLVLHWIGFVALLLKTLTRPYSSSMGNLGV